MRKEETMKSAVLERPLAATRPLRKGVRGVHPAVWILSALIVWFVSAFLLFPNLNTVYEAFFSTGTFSMDSVEKLFQSERALRSIRNSLLLAVLLTVTVNVVGTLLVLLVYYFDVKGAWLLKLSFFSTLIYGGVALNLGYKLVYGETSLFTRWLQLTFPGWEAGWFSGFLAVAFVMTFACTSNHMLFLSSAMRTIDYQTIEAARNLGASQWTILSRVVLPTLKPTLFALTILTFLTGLSATSAPLVFGGREFETITPMILTFAGSSGSQNLATVLALFLGLITVVVLAFMLRSEEKGHYISISKTKTALHKQKISHPVGNACLHAVAYVLCFLYVLPVVAIIVYSFTDALAISTGVIQWSSLTVSHYATAFSSADAMRPYLVSVVYGISASFLVIVFCLVCAHLMKVYRNPLTRTLDYVLMIPWFLPSTLIAVGLTVTYNQEQWIVGNHVFTGTFWLLLIGYIVVNIPFTLRIMKSTFFGISREMEEAARNLGASAFYTFMKVVMPLILPAVAGVFSLNFIGILPDYDLTVFLYHPLYETVGITIMNATGNAAAADTRALNLVYTVNLMIVNTLILTAVYGNMRFKRKKGVRS